MPSILKPVAFLLTLGVSLSAFPQAKAVDRITQAIDDRESVVLEGSVQPRLQAAAEQGRMDGGIQLQASMAFKRTAAQEATLEKLLAEQQDLSSANYHKWLTPEEFADRFGLSTNDVATVAAWLQGQGFAVTRVARSRTQIWFSGPVSKIETVFRTEMHRYSINGESHFANGTPLALPAALSGVVLGFRNLDDFRPKARVHSVKSNFTSSASGLHYTLPGDFATIYDVNYATADGTGEKLVVVGQSALVSTTTPPSTASDIDAFRAAAGLPARTSTNFVQTLVPNSGTPTVMSGDVTESSLDLEWAEGMAKGVNEIFVYVGNSSTFSVFDAFQYAIDQNLAPVISISYGNCEATLGATNVQIVQGWTQQANAQGQTISAASGDTGPADCETSITPPATGGLAIDVPGALPYVTSVGGSEFTGDSSVTPSNGCAPATQYWAQSCSLTSAASALMYIPETSWNDTTTASLSASGGGASVFFSKPSWQTGTGVPADGQRDVPDIALDASNGHDTLLMCVNDPTHNNGVGPCVTGFRDSNNNLDSAGGTSFAAPAFAGVLAMLNQATHSAGQGNVNPTLYALATSTPSTFHDITTGNNIVPCGVGTPDCPSTGSYGFSAGVGYDQVTGLGTLDVNKLLTNWSSGNPTAADFSMYGTIANTVISAPGGSASSTITIDARNGFNGAVTLTCSAPASALITCSITGSPVTPTGTPSTGTATLMINTTKASFAPAVPSARLGHGGPLAPLWLGGSGALLAGALIFGIPARRRRWSVVLTLVVVALVAAAVGCGGSSSSSTGGNPGTPTGNYNVTVTGTSGSTTHTTSVLVTVL